MLNACQPASKRTLNDSRPDSQDPGARDELGSLLNGRAVHLTAFGSTPKQLAGSKVQPTKGLLSKNRVFECF